MEELQDYLVIDGCWKIFKLHFTSFSRYVLFEKDKFDHYKYLFLITIILTSIVIIFSGKEQAFLLFFMYLFLIYIFFLNKLSKFKIFLILTTIIFLIILPFLFSETSEELE